MPLQCGMSFITPPTIHWQGTALPGQPAQPHHARWISEAGLPPPDRVVVANDTLSADAAFKLIQSGTALLWQGDYPNARHLLQALARRVDRPGRNAPAPANTALDAFERHRASQGRRATLLARLLVPLSANYHLLLRRGQDVHEACIAALGPVNPDAGDAVISLRGLLAIVSAYEWRKKGAWVPALDARIHPHFGVFSPVRGEYVDLVGKAPLPQPCKEAWDIGTGSGVLTCLLAKRGIPQVIGTDLSQRALACAWNNVQQLGYAGQVTLLAADLFPTGRSAADLIVCNPPWVPAHPTSPVETAVYDPDSQMLKAFLAGAGQHLSPQGEAWLILSDIAEHLGLRRRAELLDWITAGGLQVVDRLEVRPHHPKTRNNTDALHQARSAEITALWRLKKT
jgi:methylase of polypeptide subunit release factors